MSNERLTLLIFLFLLGCYLGRFANRCAVRIPQKYFLGETFRHVFAIYPLPFPGLKRRWFQLLPIVGTTFLPGWSPYSGRHVRQREPWIELFNGMMLVGLFLIEVPASLKYASTELFTIYMPREFISPEQNNTGILVLRYLLHLVLLEFLLIATLIDFDLFIIPDAVTVPPMIAGALAALTGLPLFLVPLWFQDVESMNLISNFVPQNFWFLLDGPAVPRWIIHYPWLHTVLHALAGFMVGGGAIWAVRIIGFMVLKQEAMGFGDVILMAMVGIFIGWQPVIVAIFLGAVTATFMILLILPLMKRAVIPFGPFLSLGTFLVIFCWSKVWPPAEKYFDLGIIAPAFLLFLTCMMYICLQGLQYLKWILGLSLQYDLPWSELGWTSGDHLSYYTNENVDSRHGLWKQSGWSGELSGRGQQQEQQWRNS